MKHSPRPNAAVALTNSGFVHLDDALTVTSHLDTAATATEGGLHGNRQAVLVGESNNFVGGLDRVLGAGHQGAPPSGRCGARPPYRPAG